MTVHVQDRTLEFMTKFHFVIDNALEQMGDDILNLALAKVPIDTGTLYSSGKVESKGAHHYVVSFGDDGSDAENYAGAQEAGTTRGFPMKNYTTAGTGAHYLENAGNKVAPRVKLYLEQAKAQLEAIA